MTAFLDTLPARVVETLPMPMYLQLMLEAPFRLVRNRLYITTSRNGERRFDSIDWDESKAAECIREAYDVHLKQILDIPGAKVKLKREAHGVYVQTYETTFGTKKRKVEAAITLNGKTYKKTFSVGILYKPEQILHAYLTAKYWVCLAGIYGKIPSPTLFKDWQSTKLYGELNYERAHLMG